MADTKLIANQLMARIDFGTTADKMTKAEAKDVLERIVDQCKGNIEALEDEIKNEEDGDD